MKESRSVISISGGCEHNLRNVSVDIPKRMLVAFTGVSGSGKTSLIFDTVYVEAFRRFAGATAAPVYLMGNTMWAQTTRPKYNAITGLPPALGLSQQQGVAGRLSTVGTLCGVTDLFRVYFAAFGDVYCRHCDIPLRPTPYTRVMEQIDERLSGKSISILAPVAEKRKGAFEKELEKFRQLGFAKVRVNGKLHDLQDADAALPIDAKKLNTIDIIVDNFSMSADKRKRAERAVLQALEHGKGVVKIESGSLEPLKFNTNASCPQCGESSPQLDPRHFSHSSIGQCEKCGGSGAKGEDLPEDLYPCPACGGTRLSNTRPIVRIQNRTFEYLHSVSLAQLEKLVATEIVPHAEADRARLRVLDELSRLTKMLTRVGLSHLNLNRSGGTLAPGDLQRLRLASMLSNKLNGALYVLDEPCQGLTADEVDSLSVVLRELVDSGSSVVSVEHHPVFLRHCDEIFEMGPGAGIHGGQITGNYSGKKYGEEFKIPEPHLKPAKPKDEHLKFQNINVRNLKKKELVISQQALTIIRGDAGQGKSTFLEMCLFPALQSLLEGKKATRKFEFFALETSKNLEVTHVADVRPGSLMRTSRRTVAAALEVLVPLRELFATIPTSQVLGLKEAHFSWHSKLGQCENCEGRGYIELQQRFGSPVRIQCEVCKGAKLGEKSLIPRFKGYNFADLMQLTIEEALNVFPHLKQINHRLSAATEFGLGYVKLGQGMDSLSGGELQRLTLTMELRRASLLGAWFILIHPGTGLHAPDIDVLGRLMRLMVERGASFVMLENREEFIGFADYVIELQS